MVYMTIALFALDARAAPHPCPTHTAWFGPSRGNRRDGAVSSSGSRGGSGNRARARTAAAAARRLPVPRPSIRWRRGDFRRASREELDPEPGRGRRLSLRAGFLGYAHLGSAEGAPPRRDRHVGEALRAWSRPARGPGLFLYACQERVERPDGQEESQDDDQEAEEGVGELAVANPTVVDREGQSAEVRLTSERADQRRHQVPDERAHERAERAPDNHRHREGDQIPLADELPELSEHPAHYAGPFAAA